MNASHASEPISQSFKLPSPELISQKFDLAISLLLNLWPALTVAVNESWGGPSSSEKRAWFAGAISDLFATRPDTDEDDVEDMLLQVMGDEFECQLEDGSEMGVAGEICRMRRWCQRGEFEEVDALYRRWEERERKGVGREKIQLQVIDNGVVAGAEDDDDEDEDEDEDDEEGRGVDLDGDADMEGAPALAPIREKLEPELDEEGFTKVVGKKKR